MPDYDQSTTKDVLIDGYQATITQGIVKQDSSGFVTASGEKESLLIINDNQQKALLKFGMTTNTEEQQNIFNLLINTIEFK